MSQQKGTKEPTAKEMKIFARQFTLPEWQLLCTRADFVKNMLKDLTECRKIAKNILNK